MTDERDPLDDALARGLGALAPTEFELDADQALGSLRPALHRARARRRLAVTTSTLGVLVVVVAGAAVLRGQSSTQVNVRGPRQITVPTVAPAPTTTTTTPAITSTTKRDRVTATTTTAAPLPTTTTSTPTTTTTALNQNTTTTTARPAPVNKTYSAAGGHATIRFSGGNLTLVSYTPAAGFTPDVRKNSTDEIEIRFSNGQHESRIRVRVQDGSLRPEVTEN